MPASPRRRPRTPVVLLVALAVGATVVLPARSPATGATLPAVHTPTPAPGDVVPAGLTQLRVQVTHAGDLRSAGLAVDGRDVATTTARVGDGWALTAAATLVPGGHVVRATATTDEGRTLSRTWGFTTSDHAVTRLHGATRIETAVAISRASRPADGSAGAVVLARADHFADALAGAPLAAAVRGPVLLTPRSHLASVTRDELVRVLPSGGRVHLLGGTSALAPPVADEVAGLGFEVVRHAGRDRYATAAAIAPLAARGDRVVLAAGHTFPDALAASAPAARDGLPILLTGHQRLPDRVRDALVALGPDEVIVVGGPDVVSDRVLRDVAAAGLAVRRLAGPDRWATAARIATFFHARPDGAVVTSGRTFPDALAGAGRAAAAGRPLLLVDHVMPGPTDGLLRSWQPRDLEVLGGPGAVPSQVVAAAHRAGVDGASAPRVDLLRPVPGAAVREVTELRVRVDRPVTVDAVDAHLRVGGREIALDAAWSGASTELRWTVSGLPGPFPLDVDQPARVTVRVTDDGQRGHLAAPFVYAPHDPVFARTGGVTLYEPSEVIELVGYHESNHEGAQQLHVNPTRTRSLTMESRNRATASRTAADIVAHPDVPVTAPATGTVVRAGSYVLYCDHIDQFLVIEPDGHPGWEVKMLHFRGLRVRTGDRVVAGRTVVGDGPRKLPFASQVDEHSGPRNWPHVHVEVVDPSIPNTGSGGC